MRSVCNPEDLVLDKDMTYMVLLAAVFFLATPYNLVVSANNPSDESKLITKIFSNYKRTVRPSETPMSPVQVTFNLAIRQVMDFDEKNQVVTWNVWVRQIWQDYRLKWNTSEYAVDWLTLNPTTIWVPDIYLYNNAQENYRGFDYDIEDGLYIRPSGIVFWSTQVILKSTCTFSVRFFPFDEQNCVLQFGSWTYSGNHLNLSLQAAQGDLSMSAANGEWVAVDFAAVRNVVYYSCCPEPYPSVTYTLKARRRSMFYIYSFLVPSTLIALLTLIAFFLPYKNGERVNLLITGLLSLTVYSVMISDMTPQNLDGTPLFSQFMIAVLAEISIAIIFICFIIDVEGRFSAPSRFVRIIINKWLAWLFFLKSESNDVSYRLKVMDESAVTCGKYKRKESESVIEQNPFTIEKHKTERRPMISNKQLDILSFNEESEEETIHSKQKNVNLSRKFKENFLKILKDLSEESKDDLQSTENANERRELAWAMDKLLHAFFAFLVMTTLAVILSIPPKISL